MPRSRGKREKKIRADKPKDKAAAAAFKDDGWTQVSNEKMKVLFPKDTEINHQAVLKKYHEILAVRGRKGKNGIYHCCGSIQACVLLLSLTIQSNSGSFNLVGSMFVICCEFRWVRAI